MKTFLILSVIIASTVAGDYLIKAASQKPYGLTSLKFWIGALLYGLPAIGWFHLMRSNSLASVGVFYSAATIIFLAALGFFVFNEAIGLRESIGLSLAVLSVIVMSYES